MRSSLSLLNLFPTYLMRGYRYRKWIKITAKKMRSQSMPFIVSTIYRFIHRYESSHSQPTCLCVAAAVGGPSSNVHIPPQRQFRMSCNRNVNWKYNMDRGDEGSPVISQQRTQRLRDEDEPALVPLLVISGVIFGSMMSLLKLKPRNGTFFTISTARV